jgi:RNA polymerase sigma-70 factor (ECF subfamily)
VTKYSDDKALIEGILNRDEEAFRQLVELYRDYVYRICYSFLKQAEEAEDIAQEVFIEVYRSATGFRAESKISTWIYRIAVNKSINHLNSRPYKFNFKQVISIYNKDNNPRKIESDKNDTADYETDTSEKSKILYNAIDKLPDHQKIAFTLNKIDGLPYQEIAEIMGLSLSSVESLIHRAKMNLQKKLDYYFKKS